MASSSMSRLSALAPPFTTNRHAPQHQLYDSSSVMDDIFCENPYSLYSMSDVFSGLCSEEIDYDCDFPHRSGMDTSDVSQACTKTGASLRIENSDNSSARKKFIYQDKSQIEKAKELEDYIFVQSPSTTPSNLSNFDPEISSNGKSTASKQSSQPSDNDESDIDSPCWKGKGTLDSKSPFTDVVPSTHMNSSALKTESEVFKRLNPLAPKFIPSKTRIKSIEEKRESIDNVKGNLIEPTLREEPFRCKGDFATGNVIGGSVICNKSDDQNAFITSSLDVKHVPTVAFPQVPTELEGNHVGVSGNSSMILINDLLNASELLIQNSTNDFDSLEEHDYDILQNVIDNLHICMKKRSEKQKLMSESLNHGRASNEMSKGKYMGMQETKINAVGSAYWSDDRSKYKKNKGFSSVFSERDYRQSRSFYPTTNACIETGDESTQGKYMGMQETKINVVGSAYWHDDRSKYKKNKGSSSVFSERDYRQSRSFYPTTNACIEMDDESTRIMEKLMKENHETDEELNPQALLYKNLWLEAEASLCLMKRKACAARMKTMIDGSKSD